MDPNFVQSLHNLLVQTTANDTAILKAATAKLNQEFYKKPSCIPALASILASSPEIPVRQLSAVELRKRVSQNSGALWALLPQSDREEIKAKLPDLILQEPNKLVRHSAARVIAAIAAIEVPQGTWPTLLNYINQVCTSDQVAHREVGSYILFTVLDTSVEGFQAHLRPLFELCNTLLQDRASIEVRITTVKTLGVIAQYIDSGDKDEIKAFQTLLPAIIQVVGECVEANNDEGARALFDVLETLLILEVPILSKHIPDLTQFLLTCGGNRAFDPEMRVLALNALSWTVQYKKSKIQSNNLAPAILQGLMPITTEEQSDEQDDDDHPTRSALRIVDNLSTNLPPAQVFPTLRRLIVEYFTSPNADQRRGAMLTLGIAVEGCSEYMTPLMADVWPIIEAGLVDNDATVRKAACVAVSCLCEWLQDECVAKHSVLIPTIMNLINDPVAQKAACTALDALLEIATDVIDQYLQLIMERLAGLLESAPISVKSVVTGAIGSAAHASKERFLPYFQPTMIHLSQFLLLTGEGEESELRGITMDAIGTFAQAVGKDVFRPYFPDMMNKAFEGLNTENARLHECSFLFFGVMARVFEDEFAPYLEKVVTPLINSCKQPEAGEDALDISLGEIPAAFASGESASNAIALEEDIDAEDADDLDLEKLMNVNSAIAVEKEIAADTIGTIFAATRGHFLPFVEPCVIELISLLNHYYEGIRKSAVDSLLEIVRTFYDLSEHEPWVAGLNSPSTVSTQVLELTNHVVPQLLEMYDTEDNKSVVASLCLGLAETINKVGPAFVRNYPETLSNIAIQVLEQKAICQQDPDQDDDDEAPEEGAEYDSVLISSAGDLVASLANALGHDFSTAFNTFLPLILKYAKPSKSLSDRSSAIGCLAEIIAGMKESITPHTQVLLELFHTSLGDPEGEVLSNAAFATGVLIENSTADLTPQYLHVLAALRPLFDVNESTPPARLNAKDNATGAVARMILKNSASVPLDQVLPIFIGALPLQNDYLENRPVFRTIFHLFQTNPAVLAPYLDNLLPVFRTVLDPANDEQIGDETRAELIALVGLLNGEVPDKIQAHGLGVFVTGA